MLWGLSRVGVGSGGGGVGAFGVAWDPRFRFLVVVTCFDGHVDCPEVAGDWNNR